MIAQFLHDNGLQLQTDVNALRDIILKHIEYGTIVTLYDENGLYAVARFNTDGKVAFVLDTAIRVDKRDGNTLKTLIKEGLLRFPKVKYLKFERALKNRKMNIIKIKKFLKEK